MREPLRKPASENTRADKHAFLYDGHNRKAGVSAANDTVKWRRIRRSVKRWLTSMMETW